VVKIKACIIQLFILSTLLKIRRLRLKEVLICAALLSAYPQIYLALTSIETYFSGKRSYRGRKVVFDNDIGTLTN
jgi:hypothetical protein